MKLTWNNIDNAMHTDVESYNKAFGSDFTHLTVDQSPYLACNSQILSGNSDRFTLTASAFMDNKNILMVSSDEVMAFGEPLDGQGMFMGCTNLLAVNFPLVKKLPNNTFNGCNNIEIMYLPLLNHLG